MRYPASAFVLGEIASAAMTMAKGIREPLPDCPANDDTSATHTICGSERLQQAQSPLGTFADSSKGKVTKPSSVDRAFRHSAAVACIETLHWPAQQHETAT
ncbi:uncharacterized protein L969DRAFT_70393 [Mixia osmundae IAM 14324]|uniref:Uncharacterized protein n=1 Tax=Mixia osmundae (strain CBS 9802 / IAM 14324 / JCM 22182 / KY 12970) TaxID=764103 RepID=G7DTA2_MIXOS|nr:uncharacterized protein L969DRAFT_70393 [Mixia osmundae IAM 14324]KEI42913.1 hypothetical protein L969DRAFT_70393 [Mixia osmundae IAM 14324]GAA93749.1 hypothetical protein E5Q_00395 [Mixia osmundae IAM 14324]